MKTAQLALILAGCAAVPAFAQNTTDSNCGVTNYDNGRSMFTILNPAVGSVNQQCFITVVAKDAWPGGMPDLTSSKLVEGNYEVTLSGGGGGGGGGTERAGGGGGGAGAVPFTAVRYLKPGVYRMTIGMGGQGGSPSGGRGGDGAPTSLSEAYSGDTVAGYFRAESWNGSYPRSFNVASGRRTAGGEAQGAQADGSGGAGVGGQSSGGSGGQIGGNFRGQDGTRLMTVAYSGEPGKGGTDLAGRRFRHEVAGGGGGGAGYGNGGNGDSAAEDGKMKTGAKSGELGGGGGGGAGGEGVNDPGAQGGNGFIKLALKDPVPQAAAPMQAAPARVAAPEPAPIREEARPARRDRN